MGDTVEAVMQTLQDMGFSAAQATKALTLTGWKGVEPAMDWLLAHPDDDGALDESALASAQPAAEPPPPKRVLTDEEKAEQIRKVEELRVLKRAEREAREKTEALERERRRIEDGKAMGSIRDQLEQQEMSRIAEDRRREKLDTQRAKERVKAQIEADRRARQERQAEAQGRELAPVAVAAVGVAPPAEKRNYEETRLQIRLPDGTALKQAFKVKEPLSAVRLFVQLERTDGLAGPVRLMTNFPKKVFEEADYESPLEALDLVPTAVLLVMR
eukprot:snap_masked-scaffold169_size292178-processed-gene-1.21 protein:Tk07940 transcript:snap_masked-scaffold169_size292178-processed-gene-1.21-mRNA-1 annotation:"ubx domain-containing protein 1-b"